MSEVSGTNGASSLSGATAPGHVAAGASPRAPTDPDTTPDVAPDLGAPRILLLHGPNLSQLGHRDARHYGDLDLAALVDVARAEADRHGASLDHEQHESEGDLVDRVHRARTDSTDAVIVNPGALAHYSYALRDALEVLDVPKVEVHLSNVHARERFRQRSVIAAAVDGVIGGFGPAGYPLAVQAALELVRSRAT